MTIRNYVTCNVHTNVHSNFIINCLTFFQLLVPYANLVRLKMPHRDSGYLFSSQFHLPIQTVRISDWI
jgi:hypothetical protein